MSGDFQNHREEGNFCVISKNKQTYIKKLYLRTFCTYLIWLTSYLKWCCHLMNLFNGFGLIRFGQVRVELSQVRLSSARSFFFRLGQVLLVKLRLRQVILVRIGQDRLGQVRIGQDRLGQVRIGQDRLGQVRIGQDKLGLVSYETLVLK